MLPQGAHAEAGRIAINVTNELGTALAGATVLIECPGGTYTTLGAGSTTDASGNTSVSAATIPAGANCGDTEGIDIRATKTGYVSTTVASTTSLYTYLTGSADNYNLATTTVTGMPFGLKVTVGDEFGTAVTPSITTTFRNAATTSVSGASGNVLYWADTGGAGGELNIRANGYVFATSTNHGFMLSQGITTAVTGQVAITLGATSTCDLSISANDSCKGLQATLKVTSMLDELGNNMMPTSGSAFTSAGFATNGISVFDQRYNAGNAAWYVAATSTGTGGTLTATPAGFHNRLIASVVASSTQQYTVAYDGGTSGTTYSTSTFPYRLKVITYDELGNALTGATVTHGGTAATTVSGASSYFGTTATGAILAAKDGYASLNTGVDTGLASVSTSATLPQTVITLTGTTAYTGSDPVATGVTGSGLYHGLKVTALKDSDGTAFTGAVVTAGSTGTGCSESGSTGVYYCAVPLADTGTSVQIVKSGYTSVTLPYADRTAASDPQVSVTGYLLAATTASVSSSNSGSSSGGGGGGGGGVPMYYATPSPTAVTPIVPGYIVTPTKGAGVSSVFTTRLSFGMNSDDVTRLQSLLASDSEVYPEAMVTGYFGNLTLKAVQKFQAKYDIAGPGVTGYGSVGPMTRAMLQEVFGLK